MHTALIALWLLFSVAGAILLLVGLVGQSALALSCVIPCLILGFLCRVFAEILERLMDLQERVGRIEDRFWKEDHGSNKALKDTDA